MQPLRKPLAQLAAATTTRTARICITPDKETHVKIVHDGYVIDNLPIDISDRANTYTAICALKDKILSR